MRLTQLILCFLPALAPPIGFAVAYCAVPKAGGALPCSYFVAATGSDRNDGRSTTTPFATLEKAQSAVRGASSKVVCLGAGTYKRAVPLTLTSSDSGETWQYYEPDGVNTAVLDGGGITDLIVINGGSNITINGLKLQNFHAYGVVGSGGLHGSPPNLPMANGNTVENCDIGFNAITAWNSGGVYFWNAVPNTTVKNNYVHDVGSMGIAISGYASATDTIDGGVIEGNVVLRAVQRISDGGAIYVGMHGGSQASRVTVTNNFVRDYGAPGVDAVRGIYLDDNANNVAVTGNVVGPPTPGATHQQGFLVHNGHDNHISGNIFDLGASATCWVGAWAGERRNVIAGMAGNTFTGNVVISNFAGKQNTRWGTSGYSFDQNIPPGSNYTIRNNVYHNYGGGEERSDGSLASDSNPIHEDPSINAWIYQVADNSRVYNSPVNFARIGGGWGPPGFVMPQTGTPPSSPH